MSKVGENPIIIPASVTVEIKENRLTIKGKEGEFMIDLPRKLSVKKNDSQLILERHSNNKMVHSLHGLFRSLINNGVIGVEKLWQKRLEVVGTGFNVKSQGEDLVFKLGFSHPVVFKKQIGVKYLVESNNKVVVQGINKQLVGQVAYQIKKIKKPDIYKGKGIRYEGEQIRIKPGKKAKVATAA